MSSAFEVGKAVDVIAKDRTLDYKDTKIPAYCVENENGLVAYKIDADSLLFPKELVPENISKLIRELKGEGILSKVKSQNDTEELPRIFFKIKRKKQGKHAIEDYVINACSVAGENGKYETGTMQFSCQGCGDCILRGMTTKGQKKEISTKHCECGWDSEEKLFGLIDIVLGANKETKIEISDVDVCAEFFDYDNFSRFYKNVINMFPNGNAQLRTDYKPGKLQGIYRKAMNLKNKLDEIIQKHNS